MATPLPIHIIFGANASDSQVRAIHTIATRIRNMSNIEHMFSLEIDEDMPVNLTARFGDETYNDTAAVDFITNLDRQYMRSMMGRENVGYSMIDKATLPAPSSIIDTSRSSSARFIIGSQVTSMGYLPMEMQDVGFERSMKQIPHTRPLTEGTRGSTYSCR